MGPSGHSATRHLHPTRRQLLGGAAALAAGLALPVLRPAAAAAGTPILGRSRHTAAQLVAWYVKEGKRSRATVPVAELARMFLEEGAAEGVRGDIAFCQAMVETGWLSFPSQRMPPHHNNFSGLGAPDHGRSSARFPDARTGVRAQVQHLKGWAAPITSRQLRHPLVDPQWRHFRPTGQIRDWEQLGAGRWATDPRYAAKVLSVHARLLRAVPPTTAPVATTTTRAASAARRASAAASRRRRVVVRRRRRRIIRRRR